MNVDPSKNGVPPANPGPSAASELSNLLEIISGTSAALESIWKGNDASQPYLDMLRASVERAAQVTTQLAANAGGSDKKALFHPELSFVAKQKGPTAQLPEKSRRLVLVVDDQSMALALTKRVLLEAGFEVVAAQSGFECLELFRKQPSRFDLILLDLTMPFMDGEETFERLKNIRPDVIVVLSTGFVDSERLDRMIAAGIAGFIRRPHKPDELVAHIKAVLESVKLSRIGCAAGATTSF